MSEKHTHCDDWKEGLKKADSVLIWRRSEQNETLEVAERSQTWRQCLIDEDDFIGRLRPSGDNGRPLYCGRILYSPEVTVQCRY